MIVAGLDMATATGVCLGEPGQMPTFWVEDLGKSRSHDERFSNALGLAHRLLTQHGVTVIGIEAPIKTPHDKTGTNSILMGIQSCVRGWAFRKGVTCEIIHINTLDKQFLGLAGMPSAERKKANKARCWQLGWNPATEDEADAASVWNYMCGTCSRSHAIANMPLFAEARN